MFYKEKISCNNCSNSESFLNNIKIVILLDRMKIIQHDVWKSRMACNLVRIHNTLNMYCSMELVQQLIVEIQVKTSICVILTRPNFSITHPSTISLMETLSYQLYVGSSKIQLMCPVKCVLVNTFYTLIEHMFNLCYSFVIEGKKSL